VKANNVFIDERYLIARSKKSTDRGYEQQKWIKFCLYLIEKGYRVKLYEARQTFSKYVTVVKNKKEFKVRFSNHKPNYIREMKEDCDFFVGVTNTGFRTTDDAIAAVNGFFSYE
jgi:hypothetical protein